MPLDDSNFEDIAVRAYVNLGAADEFKNDIKLIRYIKRLLNQYRDTGELRVQLVLNHLTVFYNVFQPADLATRLLIFKTIKQLDLLKPFLLFLQRWPDRIDNIGLSRETIYGSDIPMDAGVVDMLRSYKKKPERFI